MKIEECTVVSVHAERNSIRVSKEQSDNVVSGELLVLAHNPLNPIPELPTIDQQVLCVFNGTVGYVLGIIPLGGD